MEPVIKYKVVKVWRKNPNDKPHYESAFAEGEFVTSYSTKKFTKAKVGGLLVFDTLEDANIYAARSYKEIWKVEVKDKVELPRVGSTDFFSSNYIKQLWEGKEWLYGDMAHNYIVYWPEGTGAYKQVKLLEKVL